MQYSATVQGRSGLPNIHQQQKPWWQIVQACVNVNRNFVCESLLRHCTCWVAYTCLLTGLRPGHTFLGHMHVLCDNGRRWDSFDNGGSPWLAWGRMLVDGPPTSCRPSTCCPRYHDMQWYIRFAFPATCFWGGTPTHGSCSLPNFQNVTPFQYIAVALWGRHH